MDERYEIILKLITEPFKQKMQLLKSTLKKDAEDIKNKTNIKAELDTKEIDKQIDEVNSKLNETNSFLEDFNRNKVGGEMFESFKKDADELRNKLIQLNQEKDRINKRNAFKNLKDSLKETKNSFKDGIKDIKRFTLALFSIRGGWRLISKAASSYLATDQQLSNQIQSTWAGLGSFLAPIIEKIASLMIKLVSYINIFIKALTGVDLLARASAKSMKSLGKESSKTSKTLAGFDTLTNLDQTSDVSGGVGIENPFQSFENVKLDTGWVDTITRFAQFIKDNWQLVVLGIEAIALAIVSLKLASMFGAAGLEGMLVPLLAISLGIVGLTSLIMGIVELFKKGGDQTKAWTLILGGLAAIVVAIGIAFGAIPMAIAAIVAAVVAASLWVIKNWEKVKQFFVNLWDGIKTGASNAWNGVKNVFSKVGNFFGGIWDKIVNTFKKVGTRVGDAVGSAFKGAVNAVLKTIENVLNTPIKAINKMISVINDIPGINISKLSTFNLPRLATGTNYVPKDMTAVIHKGEAVVPKKYNPAANGTNNEELLNAIYSLQNTLERKQFNAYLDGQEITNTVVKNINYQSRIMGGSVVK